MLRPENLCSTSSMTTLVKRPLCYKDHFHAAQPVQLQLYMCRRPEFWVYTTGLSLCPLSIKTNYNKRPLWPQPKGGLYIKVRLNTTEVPPDRYGPGINILHRPSLCLIFPARGETDMKLDMILAWPQPKGGLYIKVQLNTTDVPPDTYPVGTVRTVLLWSLWEIP